MPYVLKWKKADGGQIGRLDLPSKSKNYAIEWARDHAQNLSHAGMTDFTLLCPDGEIVEINIPPPVLAE